MSLSDLESHYPDVPWREPIKVATITEHPSDSRGKLAMIEQGNPAGGWRYACRVCVANEGLRGDQLAALPTNPEHVHEHIRKDHAS